MGGHHIQFYPLLFCVCETGPEEHKSEKQVSIMNWVGVGEDNSKASLENLPNTFCKKSAKR
jgi:hypothetical protein